VILNTLIDVLKKIASEDPATNTDGILARQNSVPTSQHNISPTNTLKTEKLVTKAESGAKDTIPTFLGKSRQIQACFDCGKEHMMDVLYDPKEKFVCPTCERKDEDETSI